MHLSVHTHEYPLCEGVCRGQKKTALDLDPLVLKLQDAHLLLGAQLSVLVVMFGDNSSEPLCHLSSLLNSYDLKNVLLTCMCMGLYVCVCQV